MRSCKRLEKRTLPLIVEVWEEPLWTRRDEPIGVCCSTLVAVGAARAREHIFCA